MINGTWHEALSGGGDKLTAGFDKAGECDPSQVDAAVAACPPVPIREPTFSA